MPTRERKESAIANRLRKVSAYPHDCSGQNVGLYAGLEGTVDLTDSQGNIHTAVPLGQYAVFPLQCQTLTASTVAPLYELIQD